MATGAGALLGAFAIGGAVRWEATGGGSWLSFCWCEQAPAMPRAVAATITKQRRHMMGSSRGVGTDTRIAKQPGCRQKARKPPSPPRTGDKIPASAAPDRRLSYRDDAGEGPPRVAASGISLAGESLGTSLIPVLQQPALRLGPLTVHAFGLLVACAVLLGTRVLQRRAAEQGLSARAVARFVSWVLIGGFLGAHLVDRIVYFPRETGADPLSILRFWEGLSSFGGFLGGTMGRCCSLSGARTRRPLGRTSTASRTRSLSGGFLADSDVSSPTTIQDARPASFSARCTRTASSVTTWVWRRRSTRQESPCSFNDSDGSPDSRVSISGSSSFSTRRFGLASTFSGSSTSATEG